MMISKNKWNQTNNHQKNELITIDQWRKEEKHVCKFKTNKYDKPYTCPYTKIETFPQTGNVVIQKGLVFKNVNLRRVLLLRK